MAINLPQITPRFVIWISHFEFTQMPSTPNHNFTPRWTPLRPHPEQLRLWQSKARFKVIPAGRRSGKTELAKRRLIHAMLLKDKYKVPPRFFAAAPTRDQAKRIWWQDLCDLVSPKWIVSCNASELKLKLKNRAELIVLGMERPQRMEGVSYDGGIIDEYADCKKGTFDAHIRPCLADRAGWLWMIGVPDVEGPAQVEYEDLYNIARKGTDPEWAAFHWASADILPPEEIASAKRRMDPRLFEQEMLGRFILTGGRAFPDFHAESHVHTTKYDPSLPICWSLDFNINPMCSGIIQHKDGKVTVLEELVLPDTKTDLAVTAFLDRAAMRGWDLRNMRIYGDASGNCRDSTSGTSDWIIVRNRLAAYSVKFNVPRANPGIKETINAINAKLKAADDTISLIVDPKCHQLITDFNNALWPSPNHLQDEHSLAWLRYFVHREYPIRLERKKASATIGFAG